MIVPSGSLALCGFSYKSQKDFLRETRIADKISTKKTLHNNRFGTVNLIIIAK